VFHSQTIQIQEIHFIPKLLCQYKPKGSRCLDIQQTCRKNSFNPCNWNMPRCDVDGNDEIKSNKNNNKSNVQQQFLIHWVFEGIHQNG